jgi:hypothetical protein
MAEQAPTVTNGLPKVVDLHAARDRGRQAFENAFRETKGGFEPVATEAAADPAKPAEPAPAVAAEAAKPAAAATPAEPVDEFADDDADDEFADPAPTGQADPDTRRRLARLQQQEAHGREQLARREAELERREAASAQDKADAEAFRRLKQRARYQPGDVLAELGLAEDDFDLAAKDTYARTKAAAADPKWRDAARGELRTKEHADVLAAVQRELAEVKAEIKKRDESAMSERELGRYFDAALKLAGDDSPLFARHLKADRDEATRDINAIALEGLQKTGKLPSQAKLIQIYERRRATFLKKFGVDVDALIGKKTTKEQTLAAAKEQAANTTSSTTATPAAGSGSEGRRAQRANFVSGGSD